MIVVLVTQLLSIMQENKAYSRYVLVNIKSRYATPGSGSKVQLLNTQQAGLSVLFFGFRTWLKCGLIDNFK